MAAASSGAAVSSATGGARQDQPLGTVPPLDNAFTPLPDAVEGGCKGLSIHEAAGRVEAATHPARLRSGFSAVAYVAITSGKCEEPPGNCDAGRSGQERRRRMSLMRVPCQTAAALLAACSSL